MKTSVVGLLIPALVAGCGVGDGGSGYSGKPGEAPAVGEDSAAGPAPAVDAPAAVAPGEETPPSAPPAGVTPIQATPAEETALSASPAWVTTISARPAGETPFVEAAKPAVETKTAAAGFQPEANPPAAGSADGTTPAPDHPSFLFPRPEHVRGIYVNSWSAGSRRRLAALIDLAGRTEVNTFVIDIKDASGHVSHPTELPLAREVGATGDIRIPSLPWLLGRLEEAGIYPIARIVIVKDPVLAAARPHLAVQDTAGGVWADNTGAVWLNPFNREVWDYHVDLAREAAAMGVPEIQWDYVRFPDAPASALGRARFPGREGRSRTDAIREFLAYSRAALAEMGAEVTADVFGVTTSAARDVGIGQVWESFIDVVDVALPMVYPSHYWKGSFGYEKPNRHPYEIVRIALEHAVERSAGMEAAGSTRPWLQDFTLGSPRYEAPEVRAQIQAAYDAGIEEWVLWNPGSRYTEAALEPVEGFAEEPLVRIANEIVPVSRRCEVLDAAAALSVAGSEGTGAGGEVADSAGALPSADSVRRAKSGSGGGTMRCPPSTGGEVDGRGAAPGAGR